MNKRNNVKKAIQFCTMGVNQRTVTNDKKSRKADHITLLHL